MGYKDRQKKRDYDREWARRKRNGLPTQGIFNFQKHVTNEATRLRKLKWAKNWRDRKIKEAETIFGDVCYFCGRTLNLGYHNKIGEKHHTACTAALALKDPSSWVRLCYPCHKSVHWCMEHLEMRWVEIETKYV
jgi:hypothetical protein